MVGYRCNSLDESLLKTWHICWLIHLDWWIYVWSRVVPSAFQKKLLTGRGNKNQRWVNCQTCSIAKRYVMLIKVGITVPRCVSFCKVGCNRSQNGIDSVLTFHCYVAHCLKFSHSHNMLSEDLFQRTRVPLWWWRCEGDEIGSENKIKRSVSHQGNDNVDDWIRHRGKRRVLK